MDLNQNTIGLNRVVKVLQFYGNPKNWSSHHEPAETIPGQVCVPSTIKEDRGKMARMVLREIFGIDLPDEFTP